MIFALVNDDLNPMKYSTRHQHRRQSEKTVKLVPSFSLLFEESRGHIFINRDSKHRVRFMELDVRDSLMKSLCVTEKEKPKNHNMTPDDAEFIRKV